MSEMSKLLKHYNELKKDTSSIYLFRVCIFYKILNEDAKLINEKLGLKMIFIENIEKVS